jgi:hypothetical protein
MDPSDLPWTQPEPGTGFPTTWRADPSLPVAGATELAMSVETLWTRFADVRAWPRWNPSMWTATVSGGASLAAGAPLTRGEQLIWAFNPISPWMLYRLPVVAELVEVMPERRVSWEVSIVPGMWALHTYWMEPLDEGHCRFGSWEVAEGLTYRLMRPFWLAHFQFVRDASLRGAQHLTRPADLIRV